MLTLKNEMFAYSRRTEAKIGVLRDVIQRVQRGEDVDVEGVLGTGDAVKEEEWFDGMSLSLLNLDGYEARTTMSTGLLTSCTVIKELEKEEEMHSRRQKRAARKKAEEEERNKAGGDEIVKIEGRPTGPLFV
jgi:hypothetical protein